jgi:serralysin
MPYVAGTAGVDLLDGSAGADTLEGFGGNDTLRGGAGNDVLVGGAGDDTFVLHGRGFGIDTVLDFGGGDRIDLSALGISDIGDLHAFLGRSVFGDATLSLTFGGVTDRLTILGVAPADLVASSFVFATGTAGLDVVGTASADLLFGGLGPDLLSGGGGADTLIGGAGADTLVGGAGNATLRGGAGDDRFVIEAMGPARTHIITDFTAGDVIDLSAFGVSGLADLVPAMRVESGSGPGGIDVGINLTAQGTSVRVLVQGTPIAALTEARFIFGADPAPRNLSGTMAADILFGGPGADTLQGYLGDDTLVGGAGDDQLIGAGARDLLFGGAGADTLTALSGDNLLSGGPGDDVFILFQNRTYVAGDDAVVISGATGLSVVADFSASDVIDLSGSLIPDFASLKLIARQVGADVWISLGDLEAELRDTALAGLTAEQFRFAAPVTEGRRIVSYGDADDVIFGGMGNDSIEGGRGSAMIFGGAGHDLIAGRGLLSGQAGNDTLIAADGHDTLNGGEGDNWLNGGPDGGVPYKSWTLPVPYFDVAFYLDFNLGQLAFAPLIGPDGTRTGIAVTRSDGFGATVGTDTLVGIEYIQTRDGLHDIGTARQGVFAATSRQDSSNSLLLGTVYEGPVAGLDWQLLGSGGDEIFGGTNVNDFINGLGGDDAINAGGGNDVIDGGTGSNFLTGGAGRDTFFLDGRAGTTTWSTITDWQSPFWMPEKEQLSIWGYRPGVSVLNWVAEDGTAGYRGVTLHADLNGDGTVETSVTWAGRTQADLPAPLQFDGVLWFT